MHLQSLFPFLAATVAAVSITDVLSANSNELSTLTSLLGTVPQLTNALATSTNITVIAPSNAAFQAAMAAMPNLATEVKNTTFLTSLLEYHVIQGLVPSSMISTTPIFASTALKIQSATGTSSQMVEVVKSGVDVLVVSGFKQVSRVTKADLFFDGGVLHIVDTVLTEPESNSVTALDTGLTSLAGALVKTNMLAGVDTLKDATIFAPSNAAFVQVGNVVEAAGNDLLSTVLDYHIVTGGAVKSTDLMRMTANGASTMLKTLQGGTLTVRQENGALYINNAKIIVADILTSNGVVHVINNVMNPLATTLLPDTARATPVADFAGASPVVNAPFTSGIQPTTTIVPVTIAQVAAGHAAMPTVALVGAVGAAAAVFANM
ncbi:FAS1 domain-containing protein [Truncatella angustata]|uniref:FAS1 domain-containing protein n=1 Tax=Truncatella angustata TaxID=152316 RepID=A0A9P8UGP3_9PEZI|nr:FAS1 domain-containing protein [Truncatella angustata]KAH6651800.1 FAS1 domain-containing protein [Truncatella angustata]KAH8196319.1 hypothetical protein TruAng_009497 [Truncatella angustata]